MAFLTSATFVWTSLLAVPAQVLARDNRPSFGPSKPIPTPVPHDDPAWHTIDYHKAEHAPPTAAKSLNTANLTLLDQVGRLVKPVSTQDVARWKRQLHQPRVSAQQAAQLHLQLGEYELAVEEQPTQAQWHFRQARKLTKPKDPLHGLAAYDSAQALFAEGAYAASAQAFLHLLRARPGLHGFSRTACAYNLRDANACAGYHAERSALGIPEPPKLDPLCAAAALAQSLKAQGRPFDKKSVLANIRVTGRGSNLQDVVEAAGKLHLDAQIVSADDAGLIALPKPLVAYVEHDHFVSLIQADKRGVSYLCSDCGAWPGGRVNLSWKQWHKLEATHYVVISKPQTPVAQALLHLQPQKTLGEASGVQVAATKLPQLGELAGVQQWVRRLHGHVVYNCNPPGAGSTASCGYSRYSPRCLCPVACSLHTPIACRLHGGPAKHTSIKNGENVRGLAQQTRKEPILLASAAGERNRFGAQAGDPVNLASGEEDYTPEPDLVVYNPSGPAVVWQRSYNSLWGNAACPDFGMGWSNPYQMQVMPVGGLTVTHVLILPNAGTYPLHLPPLPSSGNPALWPIQGSVPSGFPLLVRAELDAPPTMGGTATTYHIVITDANRTQHVTSSVNIGSSVGGSTFITQVVDRNRNVLYFNYTGNILNSILGTLAPLPSGVPLGTLPPYMPAPSVRTLLTLVRSGGNISHVDDCYGRSVYYHVGTYATANVPPAYPQSQKELDHVSQVVTTGTTSPPDRYVLGYQNVGNGEGTETVPMLHTITVPSPTGTGTQSATINYDATTQVVTSLVDANGNSSNFNYVDGSHTQVIQKDSLGNIVYRYTVGYDMNMSQTTITNGAVDANGNNTQIVKSQVYTDPNNPYRPSQVQDGNNHSYNFAWDQFGNPTSQTSARGTTTTFTYNYTNFPLGELWSVQEGSKAPITFGYHEPDGRISNFTYPLSGTGTGTRSFIRDALGNVTFETMPGNNSIQQRATNLNYTADGQYTQAAQVNQPLTETDALGHAFHYRYDARGNVTSAYDTLGNRVDMLYNIANQPLQTQFPATGQTGLGRAVILNFYLYIGGPLTSTQYFDESGNLVRQLNYTYGPEGEALSISGMAEAQTFSYDAIYRRKSLVDGNGNQTAWSYNIAGYPSLVSLSSGDMYRFTSYNGAGQLLSSTDGRGIVTNYIYNDPEGRLTDVQHPSNGTLNVHLSYDAYGRQATRTDGTGTETYAYDDRDAFISKTVTYSGLPAVTVTRSYYADGTIGSIGTPAGTFSYSYDAAGRLTQLTNPLGENTTWSYYDNNWLATQILHNGIVTNYNWNPKGQLTQLTNTFNGTTMSSFGALTYDGAGNCLSVTSNLPFASTLSGTTNYQYDAKNQTVAEQATVAGGYSANFGYDTSGNLTLFKGQTRSYNNSNQLTGVGFSYDGNGNPISYNGVSLNFDFDNKLTVFGSAFSAQYTRAGLRASKQTPAGRRYFIYDSSLPILELTSSGNTLAVNTFGSNGLVSRWSGTSTFYSFDQRGNTVQRLDQNGNVLSSRMTDAYGSRTGSASNDPYDGFRSQQGYYSDAETGLILCTSRYYDPQTGRWLTRDPIGYKGGVNVYGYAGNNPVNESDPSGRASIVGAYYPGFPGPTNGWGHTYITFSPGYICQGRTGSGNSVGAYPSRFYGIGGLKWPDPNQADAIGGKVWTVPFDWDNRPGFDDLLCNCARKFDFPGNYWVMGTCVGWAGTVWSCAKNQQNINDLVQEVHELPDWVRWFANTPDWVLGVGAVVAAGGIVLTGGSGGGGEAAAGEACEELTVGQTLGGMSEGGMVPAY